MGGRGEGHHATLGRRVIEELKPLSSLPISLTIRKPSKSCQHVSRSQLYLRVASRHRCKPKSPPLFSSNFAGMKMLAPSSRERRYANRWSGDADAISPLSE